MNARCNVKLEITPAVQHNMSANIREDMVEMAVRFLANPKVSTSSRFTKKQFLTKKGLSVEEIAAAFSLMQQPHQVGVGRWQRFREGIGFVVLMVGIVGGLRALWKWLQDRDARKDKYEEATSELKKQIKSLSDSLDRINRSLEDQAVQLQNIFEQGYMVARWLQPNS